MCAEPLLSTSDVAEYCRVTRMGVSRWIRDGKLKAYRTPGGHFRILKSDFRVFLKCYGLPMDAALFGGEDRKHILVVSNDPDIAQHIKEALESSGECQVTGCSDAYDLGLMAATLHPEVIIVDMAMPCQNSCELCRRIMGNPVTAHVKVLGLVDSLYEEEEERLRRCGVTDLLVKPLEGQDVYQHVCSSLVD
ncbi:MAG: excisionase family DNA-binding protein [Anaerolineae bacterium]|nr:excisionase family DNA-binding protein [Anaerolineae bacterium]